MQITPQTLEQGGSSGACSTTQQQQQLPASNNAGVSFITPQQSPKHALAASRLTTPPQTVDRCASVDASSPISAASKLDSSEVTVAGKS